MTNPRSPSPYEDINETVLEEWKTETTPAERVKDIIRSTYTPVSAKAVADEGLTTTKTARKHLETLADDGFVTTTHGKHGATLYKRSGESLIVERANRLRSEYSAEELAARITELQDKIRDYRSTYDVDSPEELAVTLGSEVLDGDEPDTQTDERVVTEWQTTRRNLAFANAALSIAEAARHITGDDTPAQHQRSLSSNEWRRKASQPSAARRDRWRCTHHYS